MQVNDVMRPSPDPIESSESVQAAAERMKRENVGCLVVGNKGHLEGIVTDRDLSLRCMSDGRNPSLTLVRDVMSVGVIWCGADERIGDVVGRMTKKGLMRLPVLDRKGGVIGMISARDLVRSVPMSKLAQRKSLKVSFVKQIANSQGQLHRAPVQSVYVTGAMDHQHAEVEAIERFQSDHGVRDWRLAADALEIEVAA